MTSRRDGNAGGGFEVIHDGPFRMKTSDDTGFPITGSRKCSSSVKHVYGKKTIPEKEPAAINPNCSEIIFKLPGVTMEQAVDTLKKAGIAEIHARPFASYVLADKDNPCVPDMDDSSSQKLREEAPEFIRGGIPNERFK